MMTQAYLEDAEYDSPYRSTHRSMSNHYYERGTPYNHYPHHHHRRSHRSEYPGRHSTRTLIHEAEVGGHHAHSSRKRIGVACTRCRKRKIKCSGDIGDGSGCQACKAQGSDGVPCTFNRVGSDMIPLPDDFLANTHAPSSQDVTYSLDPITSGINGTTTYQALSHRQSLPILHTRAAHMEGCDSYNASPVDGYSYSAYNAPRNDSVYDNGYRSWSNANMLPPAANSAAYDKSPGYSFGSVSAPSFPGPSQQPPQQSQRLLSVTSETFSPLNMGNLYTSLPTQTVQSRRLPIPQAAPSYDQVPYSGPELPEIRPLAEPRTRLSSVHSRVAAPWLNDAGYSDSRNGSSVSLAPPSNMVLQPIQSSSMVSEPVVGYHYHSNDAPSHLATQSPPPSPTTGASATAAYTTNPSCSMPLTPVSYGQYYGLPPITTSYRSDSTSSRALNAPPTTSYGYHSETTTAASSDRGGSSSDGGSTGNAMPSSYASYPTICHPQPQHANNNAEALRRQASFDHQQRSVQPTQRISVSDLSSGGPPYSAS